MPISWEEFKAFLQKALGDSRNFVDSYWMKIKRDSQYQLEEVLDWAAHLEPLQAVLKEFVPTAALNEETLICYFREGLRPSIRAQLDNRGRDLDAWDEMVEKTVNAEAKASLQPPSGTRKIDSRCSKGYRPLVKKDKDNTYWEQRDETSNKDKEKAKCHNLLSSANQPQTQASNSKRRQRKGRGGGHPATGVNATKVVKKDKDKANDLSHVECYTYKQKGHYANKYPDKPKN